LVMHRLNKFQLPGIYHGKEGEYFEKTGATLGGSHCDIVVGSSSNSEIRAESKERFHGREWLSWNERTLRQKRLLRALFPALRAPGRCDARHRGFWPGCCTRATTTTTTQQHLGTGILQFACTRRPKTIVLCKECSCRASACHARNDHED
jgi:hypothetical protein